MTGDFHLQGLHHYPAGAPGPDLYWCKDAHIVHAPNYAPLMEISGGKCHDSPDCTAVPEFAIVSLSGKVCIYRCRAHTDKFLTERCARVDGHYGHTLGADYVESERARLGLP